MPSKSRAFFRDKLLPDVTALIETHRQVNHDGHGRRALGHITRSGVVMLCAAWELYIESLLIESVDYLCATSDLPDFLPDPIKGRIAQAAKNDKHEHGALKLCGTGWKSVYLNAALKETESLNTPKFGTVADLLKKWIALDGLDAEWRHPKTDPNEFVTLRGEIAHRGADASYVRITELVRLKGIIDDLVVDTDRRCCDHLKSISPSGRRPWNR